MLNLVISQFKLFYSLSSFKNKKNYLYAISIFLIYFVFYIVFSFLIVEFFKIFWIQDIFNNISSRWVTLKPFLIDSFATSLAHLLKPFFLYLSYSLATMVGGLIVGKILNQFSKQIQKDLQFTEPNSNKSNKKKGFFWELFEEIKITSFYIIWAFALIILYQQYPLGPKIAFIFFILGVLFFEGIKYLSYPFLRWRFSYYYLFKIGFKNFIPFLGFCFAASSGFFVIYYSLTIFKFSHFTFILSLLFFSLFRPLGIMGGTKSGIYLYKKNKPQPNKPKKISFLEIISILITMLILCTFFQFYSQLNSKKSLILCEYKITSFNIKTPAFIEKPVESILSLLSGKDHVKLKINIKVKNRSNEKITLENIHFKIHTKEKHLSHLNLTSLVLKPKIKKNLKLNFNLNLKNTTISLIKRIINSKNKIFLKAWINLKLWVGSFKYYILYTSL